MVFATNHTGDGKEDGTLGMDTITTTQQFQHVRPITTSVLVLTPTHGQKMVNVCQKTTAATHLRRAQ